MKHAHLENGTVKEVARVDPFSIFHSSYASLFVECPDEVEAGWTFDGEQWSAPVQAAPTVEQFDRALTAHLDATAQSRRYDNRITCALRAGYVGPFQAEGQAFATWMDACNWQAYQILAGVQSGALTMPTVDEFLADLPEMVWPT